jgi:hypothetical protein
MALVKTEKLAGIPIQAGSARLIPVETATRFQPPGMWGVLLWRRPTAVVVQHAGGDEEVIPIRDATRQAQLTLLGIGLLGSLLVLMANLVSKKNP